jgi:cytosine/adenosine deaminase-related metal-dependent hydrolase
MPETGRLLLRPRWLLDADGRILEDARVVVEGNRIREVLRGPAPSESDARVVDLPRHLLLPGLINAHTHAGPGPIARGIGEDLPLATGAAFYVALAPLWKLAYGERFRDELRTIVRWDVFGMLRTGTTTIVQQSSVDFEGYIDAVTALGVRTYACPILPLNVEHRLGYVKDGAAARTDTVTEDEQTAELRLHQALFKRHDGSAGGRIRLMLSPASAPTVPMPLLRQIRRMADEFDCPISTHLCQAPSEVEEARARYGKTPVQVLAEANLLGPDLICAHATYVEESDLGTLRESGTVIAHCASRKAKEAIISPYQWFVDAGIPVALGTDSFQCDLLEDMKTAALLGKIATGRVERPSVEHVFASATTVGADSLGRSDLGRLEAGALADLIAVDLGTSHTAPVLNPLRSAVYYASGQDVDCVVVDGEVRVLDGRAIDVDERALSAQVQTATERIWEAAEREGVLPVGALTASR